jgi:tetratricopeptide (TPR) repeat protein
MVRSIRLLALVLAWTVAALTAPCARADDKPTSAPAEQTGKKPDQKAGAGSAADRAQFYLLLGEDPAQPYVPLKPRTVEERKHLDAVLDYGVARALEDRRNWAEAIALLEQALKLEPDSITVLRRLSALCFSLGRTEQGVKYSKHVLEAEPGDTATITRLVGYYRNRNDAAGAEAVLKDVLANPKLDKHAPGRLVSEYELGKLYATRLKQPDHAADAFARVLEALDDKSATRLSPADQNRVLGGDEAAAYQEFGEVFDEAKRYDLAAKAYQRGLVYEPESPSLPLKLAEALLHLKKGGEALSRVEGFLKRQPNGVEGYELLAKILKALDREAEITPRLEAAAGVDSKNVPLQYVLADRYREIGQVERAEKMYESLLKTQPGPQGYAALAASLLRRKKAEDLVKVIEQAVKIRPGGIEAVQDQIKGIIDDPEMADKVLAAGAKLYAADPPQLDREGIQILAYIATRADKLDKFLPLQRLVLQRAPNAQSYKELISLLGSLKNYVEAAATFDELLKKFPGERNARTLAELAIVYRQADKLEEAIATAREALKLDPNDSDALVQLAVVLSQTGKVDESVDMLKAAAAKDQANPQFTLMLGSILSQASRHEEALAIFKGLLEKFPNNDKVVKLVRSNLSIVYVNMGDYAKGEAELESLLEQDPDDAGVNNDLGYLYADQGKNLEKAEAMIRKAIQEDGENNAYLDSLGWVLFKRGKAKEAVEPLEKAAKGSSEKSASDATIFEHLGDVYFELRETAKAKAAWTSAEKAASKSIPPDKRLPEIRKKLGSLKTLDTLPKESSGATP